MKKDILMLAGMAIAISTISQNVGIGTTTPLEKLSVETAINNYGISHTGGAIKLSTYVGGLTTGGYLGTISNHPLSFFTNDGSAQITLLQNGNVGIGTSNPLSKLHIYGGSSEKIRLEGSVSSIGFYSIFDGTQQALMDFSGFGLRLATFPGTGWPIRFYTNGLEVVTILSGGNVGIGTINPAYKLEVNGTANFRNSLYLNDQPGTSGQILTSAGAGSIPTWENPPQAPQNSFYAFLSSNTSIASGTPTTITGYNEHHDNGNNFNITTGQFIAPANGVYHFDTKMSFSSPASGNTPLTLRIKKNGSVFEGCQSDIILQAVTGYTLSISHAVTISLLVGDVITIEVIQSSAGSLSLLGGSSAASCFSGYQIY